VHILTLTSALDHLASTLTRGDRGRGGQTDGADAAGEADRVETMAPGEGRSRRGRSWTRRPTTRQRRKINDTRTNHGVLRRLPVLTASGSSERGHLPCPRSPRA
jgi:hypothetical protein